jgi:hypothetical protein
VGGGGAWWAVPLRHADASSNLESDGVGIGFRAVVVVLWLLVKFKVAFRTSSDAKSAFVL